MSHACTYSSIQFRRSESDRADIRRAGRERTKLAAIAAEPLEILKGGDWVGKGADKFYGEMDSAVLPALKRLITALETAQRVTRQISKIHKDTKESVTGRRPARPTRPKRPALPKVLAIWLTPLLRGCSATSAQRSVTSKRRSSGQS